MRTLLTSRWFLAALILAIALAAAATFLLLFVYPERTFTVHGIDPRFEPLVTLDGSSVPFERDDSVLVVTAHGHDVIDLAYRGPCGPVPVELDDRYVDEHHFTMDAHAATTRRVLLDDTSSDGSAHVLRLGDLTIPSLRSARVVEIPWAGCRAPVVVRIDGADVGTLPDLPMPEPVRMGQLAPERPFSHDVLVDVSATHCYRIDLDARATRDDPELRDRRVTPWGSYPAAHVHALEHYVSYPFTVVPTTLDAEVLDRAGDHEGHSLFTSLLAVSCP